MLALLAGCNFPLTVGESPTSGRQGVCAQPITPEFMGMDLEAAARLPYPSFAGGEFSLIELGLEMARQRAEDLIAVGTFCDEPLPEGIAQVLDLALEALRNGDKAQGLATIRTLIASGEARRGHGRARTALQAAPDWRARIGATIQFAEELALQGDQASYDEIMQNVADYFAEQAQSALEGADFEETLRFAEESLLLGRDDVFQRAKERLHQMLKERLEQALKDLDPCLPNPDVLDQAIRDLLNALADAQFFGTPGTNDGEALYEQAVQQFEKAAANYEAMARGEPPNCGYRVEFTLEGALGSAELSGSLRSCQCPYGPWEGSISLHYDDAEAFGCCDGDGKLTFTIPKDKGVAEGTVSFGLSCGCPPEGCYYPSASESLAYSVAPRGQSLELEFHSNGGSFTMVCPEDPFTLNGPWAWFWGENRTQASLVPDTSCP